MIGERQVQQDALWVPKPLHAVGAGFGPGREISRRNGGRGRRRALPAARHDARLCARKARGEAPATGQKNGHCGTWAALRSMEANGRCGANPAVQPRQLDAGSPWGRPMVGFRRAGRPAMTRNLPHLARIMRAIRIGGRCGGPGRMAVGNLLRAERRHARRNRQVVKIGHNQCGCLAVNSPKAQREQP
jgi:hypothetical protein